MGHITVMTRRAAALAGALALAVIGSAATASGAPAHPHGSCADARGTLLFCEDFEALPRGATTGHGWGVNAANGTVAVERDTAHGRGHRAGQVLHVRTEGNGHAFVEVTGLSAPRNSFYGRMRVRIDALPSAPDWAHFTLVEATGTGDGSVVRPIGGQYVPTVGGGTDLWGVGSDGGPTGDWTNWQAASPAEAGRWTCVEWRLDASDNQVSVWLDGRAHPDLTVDTTAHGGNPVDFVLPRIDTVRMGWQLYQPGPTPSSYDLRLDDLALSTHRLGCAE
ncbi:hypothetical protein [Streptomyces sp. NRRL F-5123]|uniref:hypothetical protein n=1 Tax=Streptomyces sp. NRRL F-5123 TaxID=1463856 RepID=UPI000A54550D|nr:hypothetical protein [Streptomyces sp. NRRL F-5123]